jgi:hypothetical protein
MTPHQAAEYIIARLYGYRQNSLGRADDTDSLTAALEAFVEIQKDKLQ